MSTIDNSFNTLSGAQLAPARDSPGSRPALESSPPVERAAAEPAKSARSTAANAEKTQTRESRDLSSATVRELDPEEAHRLTETLDELNQYLVGYNTNLEFAVDDEYETMVVRVVDRETREVVQQIPPKQVLAFAEHLKELEETTGQRQETLPGAGDHKASKRLQIEGWLVKTMA